MNDFKKEFCLHNSANFNSTYISAGENLLGQEVKSQWQKINCPDCHTEKIFLRSIEK